MQLRYNLDPSGNSIRASVQLDGQSAITPVELQHLVAFGDVQVNIGGLVHPASGADVTLPDNVINWPADQPAVSTWSFADYSNADKLATAWKDLVVGNISTAVAALLARTPPTATGVITIPLS